MTSPRASSHSPSPSPTKVRFHVFATSSNMFRSKSNDSASSSSLQSDSDSDGDDRVFFGSPKVGEEALVARLSKAVPATPRSRLSKRDSREFLRRKTILVTPPRKLVDPEREASDEEDEEAVVKEASGKKWPGGFHERRQMSDTSDSDSSSSSGSPPPALYAETPGRRIEEDHCDLTFDLSRFRISDSPLSNMAPLICPTPIRRPSLLSRPSIQADMDGKSEAESSASESEEEEWSDTEGEDSDKENAPAPMEAAENEEEERVEYPLFEGPLTGSRNGVANTDEDDMFRELDMGGLRLGDFADPDMDLGDILLDTQYTSDYGFSSREPSEDGHGMSDNVEREERASSVIDENETVKLQVDAYALHQPSPSRDVLGEIVVESLAVNEQDIIAIEETTQTTGIDLIISPSPSIPNLHMAPLESPSPSPSSVINFDSPLPLARGGPVIIPTYHSPIYTDPSSPFRPYSPIIHIEAVTPPPFELAEPTHLARSSSPDQTSPSSGPSSRTTSTPTAQRYIPANTQFQAKQALKSSLTTSTNPIPIPASLALPSPLPLPVIASNRELRDEEAAKRSEAIKSNLATVFSGKSIGLGAPQRSVSASSGYSSSAGSGASGASRTGSRSEAKPVIGWKEKERKVGPAVPAKEARTIPVGPATRKRPLPGSTVTTTTAPAALASSASSSTSTSSARPPIASSGFARRPVPLPRPVLAPRTLHAAQPTLPNPSRAAAKLPPPRPAAPASTIVTRPSRQLPQNTTNPTQSQSLVPQWSNMPIYLSSQPLQATSPNSQSCSVSHPNSTSNPLKRPLPPSFGSHPATAIRSAISTGNGPTRPTLGLPSRVVGDQVFTLNSTRMPALSENSPPSSRSDSGSAPGGGFSLGYSGGGVGRMRSPERPIGNPLGGGAVRGTPMSVRTSHISLSHRMMNPDQDGGGVGKMRSPERPTGKALGGGAFRGTPMSARAHRFMTGTPSRSKLGSPSRGLGTPSRIMRRMNTGPPIQVFSARLGPTSSFPFKAGQNASTSPTTNPPSANTRHANNFGLSSSGIGRTLGGHRGSSEDQEDVSFALPALGGNSSEVGSSPLKTPKEKTPDQDVVVAIPESSPAAHTRAHGRDVHPSKLPSVPDVAPASSDPSPTNGNTRPKRTIKPPAPAPVPIPRSGMSVAANTLSIAPNLSEKELKAKTSYNTVRNEKYFCAIDRQIVRVGMVRPPSPTSTIPTTEQREEEAKKREREMRVRRRKGKGKAGEEDMEAEEEEEVLPIVRRLEGAEVDWKGDEEGWEEMREERPAKRARVGSAGPSGKAAGEGEIGRSVKWDKGLVIIRDEGGPYDTLTGRKAVGHKSALKVGKQVELDPNGNILTARRPKETVKPLKIAVTVRVYEGEEPDVPISQTTRGKKKAST